MVSHSYPESSPLTPRSAHRAAFWARSLTLVGAAVLLIGCSKSSSESAAEGTQSDKAYMASDADASGSLPPTPGMEETSSPIGDGAVGNPANARPDVGQVPESLQRMAAVDEAQRNAAEAAARDSGEIKSGGESESDSPEEAPGTQLPPDLTLAQLVEFLSRADKDMQEIWSRLPQIPNGREELIRIAKMKLEASRRLSKREDANEQARSIGARGELQALSHLASFSDLEAAEALEALAKQNLNSEDPELVADSRLVLIGFALESLQNGENGAVEQVIDYVNNIKSNHSPTDVPTLMVLGQTRDALAAYGHPEQANQVRDTIVELYSNSPNPDLAQAARELASGVMYDKTDQLVNQLANGRDVGLEQWREAAKQLLEESSDLATVQYLAGVALQMEARGRDDLVEATFDALQSGVEGDASPAAVEVQVAMAAKDARHNIIGVGFNPVLPATDGEELSMDSVAGKVVLVPFWAAAFPESLQIIGRLKEIQASHPDDVAIVGVNLDGDDLLLKEFLKQNEMGFPSFRSASSAQAEVANPVAAQFGIASMPFLAIVDRDGKVAAVNFTGQGIEAKIDQLLSN